LAAAQFGAFLRDAPETDADLVVTPESSMPWSTLSAALQAAITPCHGKLWAIGCESIRYNELQQLKQDLARVATVIFEALPVQQHRFLDSLAYIFLAPPADGNGAARLVMLGQFKTFPMADNNHFETNGMQRGTRIYRFGVAGQRISLVALICSDALDFYDADAAIYDRALIVHTQMNPSPRHDRFRQYRDKLLGLQGDTTEILCLNWAKGVRVLLNGQTQQWQGISGSAWHLHACLSAASCEELTKIALRLRERVALGPRQILQSVDAGLSNFLNPRDIRAHGGLFHWTYYQATACHFVAEYQYITYRLLIIEKLPLNIHSISGKLYLDKKSYET
jgi:hypothetical protein